MKRVALWAFLLLLTTACSNASGDVGVGYQAGPVEFSATFSIHPNGSISVGGSVGLVTEIGVFSLSAHVETSFQPAPDETLLFIRHRVGHGVLDTGYRINTGEDVTVVVDGLTTINVANHEVMIDASKGKIKKITIHNQAIGPAPAQQSQPPSSNSQAIASAPAQQSQSPLSNLRLLRTIRSSTISIGTISWSPDSQLIADAGSSGDTGDSTVAEIRRASDGSLVSTHGDLTHYVHNISWSPNGTLIAATDQGCSCTRIWNASSGQTTGTIDDYLVDQISWAPDSRYIVTSGNGDQPTVWSASTGEKISSFDGYPAFGNPAAWAPHGNLITGGGEVWDAMSGRQVQVFKGLSRGQFNTFSWSPDAHSIVSASGSDLVDWDIYTGAIIWDVPVPPYASLLSWSPSGKYIAWGGDVGGAGIWTEGYTFLVMRDPGQQVISTLGMHACFDPPSSRAGSVTTKRLMEGIEEKVRKYKGLATQYAVPLIIAVGAHRFTGVTLGLLDDTLTGLPAPKVTLQFNAGDPHIGTQTFNWGPVAAWPWPDDLAGLLWIENELPFNLTARPNPAAQRQMPVALLPSP